MQYNTNEIKALNPLTVYLEKYGIQVDRKGFARCPFHNEKTPSFKVYTDSNTYYCFGCGESGDVITFIQKIENVSFGQVCEMLYGKVSFSQSRKVKKAVKQQQEYSAKERAASAAYWQALNTWEFNENIIRAYLPKDSYAEPHGLFTLALSRREQLLFNLETAESEYNGKGVM